MARHHRPVIVIATVVVVAAVTAGAVTAPGHSAYTLQLLLLLLAFVAWILAFLSAQLRRPAALVTWRWLA